MHLMTLNDLSKEDILKLIATAQDMKANPKKYAESLKGKTLLTMFEMPSLRTKISFDVGMKQLGGFVTDYQMSSSPWAKGKESVEDSARVMSRFVQGIMIRMHDHAELVKFAEQAQVPVINGLTSFSHPCQVLSDLLTMTEKFGELSGKKLAYFGDSNNNVTHSLLFGCTKMGMTVHIACPDNPEYAPNPEVLKIAPGTVSSSCEDAAKDADVIYTDSWMSYRISPEEKEKRLAALGGFQVKEEHMALAKDSAIFMHDLPATREMEVTAGVMDGPHSVIYDQAENRMHMQKAILLKLLE